MNNRIMKRSANLGRWGLYLLLSFLTGWALGAATPPASAAVPKIVQVRCENQESPLGIDSPRPRLSWVLESSERGILQSAYQILVSRSSEKVNAGEGDLWDSGKIKAESNRSVHVPYAGKPLVSGARYYWKVRVWDQEKRISEYSKPAWFEMGLLEPKEWGGQWIGGDSLLRKEFRVTAAVERARVYIAAVGYYELSLNGVKVGDHVLDPGWTEFKQTVLYTTYDVTAALKQGPNAFGVMLGNGRYSHPPYNFPPRMMFRLDVDYADGTRSQLFGDETWTMAPGPVVSNSVYHGENYDARLEQPGWDSPGFSDSTWRGVRILENPTKTLRSQTIDPIKVIETKKPLGVTNPQPGVYVYDMGQNFAGWSRLSVEGPRGSIVTLRFGEDVKPDGNIDPRTNGEAKNTDVYTLKGGGKEVWEPRFTYRGFRYVEVTGFPGEPKLENLEGRVVHNSVAQIGGLQTSNDLINRIHTNILWSIRSNLSGVLTDCPQRAERCGWLEVGHTLAESLFFNYDMSRFYEKWVDDCGDAQRLDERFPQGSIPTQVPFMGWACWPGDVGWSSFYVIAPWHLYQHNGDLELLKKHYGGLKLYIQYLEKEADGFIIDKPHLSSPIGYSPTQFGDWGDPDSGKNKTPKDLHGTAFFYYCVSIMSQVATALNEEADAKLYTELAGNIKKAFNSKYFDQTKNVYGTGSQFCNAMPLYLNLVPEGHKEAVLENLVRNVVVDHGGHLSIGEVGLPFLIRALTEQGRADVVYGMITNESHPSWGSDIKKGFTTLPEFFGGGGSHNHNMWGTIDEWFYKALAGINIDPAQPGYKRVIIKPRILGDLKNVNGSVQTVRGLVASAWERQGDSLVLKVTIPDTATAEINVPKIGLKNAVVREGKRTVWRDGRWIEGVNGITGARESEEYVSFDAGSGVYDFEIAGGE